MNSRKANCHELTGTGIAQHHSGQARPRADNLPGRRERGSAGMYRRGAKIKLPNLEAGEAFGDQPFLSATRLRKNPDTQTESTSPPITSAT
jgi:hypothetical protein